MDEHLRIGDAEREQAATELGEHYAQGRLTAEEHAERLDRVWSARTRGELGPLFVDLPGPAGTRALPGERAAGRAGRRRRCSRCSSSWSSSRRSRTRRG